MDKKQKQLGINPSTASGRLIKDLLFNFVIEAGHVCFRCGRPLNRETFSIEHIVPWLDSEIPTELFFDRDNIAYSHLSCNVGAARRNKVHDSKAEAKKIQWARYYAKKKEQVLERKRERYHNK